MRDYPIVVIESDQTDLFLGKDEEGLGLFGASGELLYYVGKADAELFRKISDRLEGKPQMSEGSWEVATVRPELHRCSAPERGVDLSDGGA